ncbi:MAG: TIGR02569 family protein, partial [Actinomycetota bacterium]|nr:TIGR02569 family protein [Actinomycetota bacterium]
MAPPASVVAAFGAGPARVGRLAGGQGRTWRVGDLVLKPVDHVVEHAWVSEVFAGWRDARVRVPEPVRAVDGSW